MICVHFIGWVHSQTLINTDASTETKRVEADTREEKGAQENK